MIQLSTTLYEKNFRQVLNNESWFLNLESDYISSRLYVVNNMNESSREEFYRLKSLIGDRAVFVETEDIWRESLDHFRSDMRREENSWWYSIQYFCQMYYALKSDTEFVFNVGADCTIDSKNMDDFFLDSINILQDDPSVLLTTTAWSPGDFSQTGEHEQNFFDIKKRNDKFWMSKVVSDRSFMCSAKKCLNVDFNNRMFLHPFPGYGGDSFEKNFTNFLIEKDFFRAIHKGSHFYTHSSF